MFENSLRLVEDCGLTWLHVFPFSPRAGTPAARMPAVAGGLVRERAERLRDSRVAAQHRTARGSVTVEDLETIRSQDVVAAVRDACAEKDVPIEL